MNGKPSIKRVRFTKEENAIDYLEIAVAALERLPKDPLAWKWIVIGLHGSLYAFAICLLERNNWENVVTGPKRRVIPFGEALKRSQKYEDVIHNVRSKPLTLTPEQKDSIDYLQKLRNRLEHYVPMSLYVEEHGLVLTALDAVEAARFLALETGMRLNQEQRRRVDVAARKGKRTLEASQLYKDHVAAMKRQRGAKRTVPTV